jgi:FKBP-type peptidyl-prolyl cis-trans isomerase
VKPNNKLVLVIQTYSQQVVYSSSQRPTSNREKPSGHICYDASADWEDEEYDQEQNSLENAEDSTANSSEINDYVTYNNGVNADVAKAEERTQISRTQQNYEDSANQDNSVDMDNNEQEIVEASENNLVYTVLGAKKNTRATDDDRQDVEYVEVRLSFHFLPSFFLLLT